MGPYLVWIAEPAEDRAESEPEEPLERELVEPVEGWPNERRAGWSYDRSPEEELRLDELVPDGR